MKSIGVYREMVPDIPEITESIFPHIAPAEYPEKTAIVTYLRRSWPSVSVPQLLRDVFDKQFVIGSLGVSHDGEYSWRSDLAYYIDKYNLRPPEDFIAHVMEKMGKA